MVALGEDLVDRKHWATPQQFNLAFGLARLTPGTNVLGFGVGIGWLLRGFAGAITTLLAGSVPCSLLALLVTALYGTWSTNRFVILGLRGASAAAVGIMLATGWSLMRPYWTPNATPRIVILVGGSLALGLLSFSPLHVLFAAVVVGALWPEKESPIA